jgi:hypothetical protein
MSNQPLPEDVRNKVETEAISYYPRPEFDERNHTFRHGAEYGYSLALPELTRLRKVNDEAMKELTKLREEIKAHEENCVDYDKKLTESRQEGERLRGLIVKAWQISAATGIRNEAEMWRKFVTSNNLK